MVALAVSEGFNPVREYLSTMASRMQLLNAGQLINLLQQEKSQIIHQAEGHIAQTTQQAEGQISKLAQGRDQMRTFAEQSNQELEKLRHLQQQAQVDAARMRAELWEMKQ